MQLTEQVDADAIATEYCCCRGRVGRSGDGARRPFGRLVGPLPRRRWCAAGRTTPHRSWNSARARCSGSSRRRARSRRCCMLDKYSAFLNWMRGHLRDDLYVTSIPDKYLFLTVAMAVTGIVTVLKWDQILPDAQDYLNFAPLPVRSRQILLANAVAILTAVLVVAVAVNAIPDGAVSDVRDCRGARRPSARSPGSRLAHAGCVILASVFSIAVDVRDPRDGFGGAAPARHFARGLRGCAAFS